MNLKKIAAAVAILGTIGLGVAAPADAKPHGGWDCGCDGGAELGRRLVRRLVSG